MGKKAQCKWSITEGNVRNGQLTKSDTKGRSQKLAEESQADGQKSGATPTLPPTRAPVTAPLLHRRNSGGETNVENMAQTQCRCMEAPTIFFGFSLPCLP